MHAMNTLEDLNMKGSLAHQLSQGLFVLTYTIARVFLAPILTWNSIVCLTNSMLIKVEAVLMQLVSFGWFGYIVYMIWMTLSGKTTEKDKKKQN